MNWRSAARQLPLRLSSGAFLLNSGLSKVNADEATAQQLHGFASGTYDAVSEFEAQQFVRLLSAAELTLAAALLAPVVPAAAAGAGLAAFSLGTLGLYLRTPGMRQGATLRPTEQGLPLAKDVWLLGIGVGLIIEGLTKSGRRCA